MADFPYDRDVDEAHERERRASSTPSSKPTFTRAAALAVAQHLVTVLAPACERVEIAGSLRRGRATVHDVEIVAQPRPARDLFGAVDERAPCELDQVLARLEREGRIARRETAAGQRWGPKWKAAIAVRTGVPIDLFCVRPPAQWGAILAIRTGPASLSERLVTQCKRRGLRCEDGRLVTVTGQTLETPDERAFFALCGVPFVPPEERG